MAFLFTLLSAGVPVSCASAKQVLRRFSTSVKNFAYETDGPVNRRVKNAKLSNEQTSKFNGGWLSECQGDSGAADRETSVT